MLAYFKKRALSMLILVNILVLVLDGLVERTFAYAWDTANTGEKVAICILLLCGFVSTIPYMKKTDKVLIDEK